MLNIVLIIMGFDPTHPTLKTRDTPFFPVCFLSKKNFWEKRKRVRKIMLLVLKIEKKYWCVSIEY